MRLITGLGSTIVLDVIFLVAIAVLLARRYWRNALFLLLASPGTVVLVQVLKHAVNRARPTGHHLAAEQGASWPSGHASSSMALYGALMLIAVSLPARRPQRVRALRLTTIFMTIAVVVLIGLSRVYLAVHYATDVLAAWLLVVAWLTILMRNVGPSAATS